MEFPRFVYKKGGVHQMKGGTYSYLSVEDQCGYDAALSDGWAGSMVDLDKPVETKAEAKQEVKIEVVEDENAPPTRDELAAKCKELGIEFHHKAGDAKLAALIADKLAA
jgi:hypothetical protein